MKLNVKILGVLALGFGVVSLHSCVENDETGEISTTVQPQDLPETLAGNPDFKFPEKESVIMDWLETHDSVQITKHAWGIWQGLTSESDQVYNGNPLLTYQTWLGVSDLAKACADGDKEAGCNMQKSSLEFLSQPNQHHHISAGAGVNKVDLDTSLYVTVSYSPGAACYATSNLIFNQSTITSKLNDSGGIGAIDPFPSNGVTLKPTYYIGKTSDKYIRIPSWHGPPSDWAKSYPAKDWQSYVYADVSNSQKAGKIAVPTAESTGNPPASAIVNLNEFIHYSLDANAAEYMNEQEQGQAGLKVEEGDLAILVAMHVGTKEISNWTWQTFFWTTDPSSPDFPSSSWEAALMPDDLTGAASHYAVSTSYAMVWPNQPVTGGTNENVTAHIGYNPYLEASLSKFNNVNRLDSTYQYGMQSNCMSCHALATSNAKNEFFTYTADQYIDMRDTMFNGWVQLDFAWSIQGNINKDK